MSKPDKKVKAVIIGCGAIAEFHFNALNALKTAEVIGVYGNIKEQCDAFAEKHGIKAYHSIEEVYASDCDMVTICTPSGTHADLAVNSMLAGKHVTVEKPLAITAADCDRVLETEKLTGKICAPVSQLRYSDSVRKLKEAVDAGKFGKPVLCSIYMKFYRSKEYYAGSWRGTKAMDGGGALMNQGIHGIDILRYVAGDVKSVSAKVSTLVHDIEVEDTAVAAIEFESGALGVIEGATSVVPGYPRRMEICGDKGSVAMEEDAVVRVDAEDTGLEISENDAENFKDPNAFSFEGHRQQFGNIVNTILGTENLDYTCEDAAKTVKLILAIYESSEKGVKINL